MRQSVEDNFTEGFNGREIFQWPLLILLLIGFMGSIGGLNIHNQVFLFYRYLFIDVSF